MGIPANYKVLFLQGGASAQFAMVPMNLLRGKAGADYLNTGEWSKKAIKEAKKFGDGECGGEQRGQELQLRAGAVDAWKLDTDAAYVHYTPNETIGGVEIFWTPETGDVPLVADMSSTILSRPIDVSKFGLIYAGAQKNIGPAGLTIVIVRDDLIGQTVPGTPTMFDYKTHADNESMYNTPPTFAMYIGGTGVQVAEGERRSDRDGKDQRATRPTCCMTRSMPAGFYASPVAKDNRSRMNMPFTLKDAALDEDFLKGAKARGLVQLKGHRSVGGMRASIYNAMPIEGVRALVDYMRNSRKTMAKPRKILTLNAISARGLARLPQALRRRRRCRRTGRASWCARPTCTRWRFPPAVRAIARAGAGTNNIPVKKLSERGVPVFNAPGANANAVKELVIAGMLMGARNIVPALKFVEGLSGTDDEMHKATEAGKKHFAGTELPRPHAGRDRPGRHRLLCRRGGDQARHERGRLRPRDHGRCRLAPAVAGQESRERGRRAASWPISFRCTCRCWMRRATSSTPSASA